ncbi:hypothetical protein [Bacillus benzoevorans]|uniref:DksA C4-type domain-containing protein n=1 Tax=Bacillus benzoevorans TaxID=1456 RepID=A0A7X0HQI4_9BACI|nr:hypothetical protein [Bacillus benzoevorans]MBB6443765.1 hypothetical protein [Bacillus benzoevorans]
MDMNTNEIYSELRKTKQELLQRLEDHNGSPLVKPYILGELKDIESALNKLEKGTFGTCEISGEILPQDLLALIPILKSVEDCQTIRYFFRKT